MALVAHEAIGLDKRSRIEEFLDALAGGFLAARVLLLDRCGPRLRDGRILAGPKFVKSLGGRGPPRGLVHSHSCSVVAWHNCSRECTP